MESSKISNHATRRADILQIDIIYSSPFLLLVLVSPLQDSLSLSKTLKQVSMLGSPALETKEYKYLTGEEEQDLGLLYLQFSIRGVS